MPGTRARATSPTPVNGPLTPLGFVALLTLIACVIVGLAWWSWVPAVIGAVVLGAYLGIEISDSIAAHRGRSP